MVNENAARITIGVGISFYNDVAGLRRTIKSLDGNANFIFCIDGRYIYNSDYFPDTPLSSDGSRQYVDSFKYENYNNSSKIMLIDKPDLTESKKRQTYCELCKDYCCDVLIILDSDEYVYACDWAKFREECYQKMFVRDKADWHIYNILYADNGMMRPRLWLKPYDIIYGLTHYEFYLKSDTSAKPTYIGASGGDDYHTIENIVIKHDSSVRNSYHNLAREKWEARQLYLEDENRIDVLKQPEKLAEFKEAEEQVYREKIRQAHNRRLHGQQ